MIPILYNPKETDFSHNGLGMLAETTACIVTEERNGAFEAELKYPITGRLYSQISVGCVVKAKANEKSAPQLFRIYKSSKPINGVVAYNAEHISYALSRIPIESVSKKGVNAQTALDAVLSAGLISHNFEAYSDIDTTKSISLSEISARAALGGTSGSILDVYGGEYEFDNFIVKLHSKRGMDSGVRIAYGKNLTSFKQEENISAVYSAVFPYAKYMPDSTGDEEVTVTLPEKIIYSENADAFDFAGVCIKDFSDFFEDEEPTVEKLREIAQGWVKTSGFDTPSVNITVSFKHLWQSPEYRQYTPLERASLCDTVTVFHERLGISVKAKVVKTKYNSLKEDYESLTLGSAKANFADAFNSNVSNVESTKKEIAAQGENFNSKLAQSIASATAAITGQSGGYVVLNPSENPQEILILDTPKIETAMNVWRWNSGGLGHSSNGYNGTFTTAITTDGKIVADFIAAGQLNGALLKAGSVQAEALAVKFATQTDLDEKAEEITQSLTVEGGELDSFIEAKYPTKTEVSSEIIQLSDKVSIVVTSSESGNAINSAGIIAAINDDTSSVTIDAEKINLTSYAKTTDVYGTAVEAVQDAVGGITLSAQSADKSSTVKILSGGVEIASAEVSFSKPPIDADELVDGTTVISGDNILTGMVSAERIETENLGCTRLRETGNPNGAFVRINSGMGDFGLYNGSAENSDGPGSGKCIWGLYHNVPDAVNFWVFGDNYLGHSYNQNKTYPKGTWDFSSATVAGLGVVPVFGE